MNWQERSTAQNVEDVVEGMLEEAAKLYASELTNWPLSYLYDDDGSDYPANVKWRYAGTFGSIGQNFTQMAWAAGCIPYIDRLGRMGMRTIKAIRDDAITTRPANQKALRDHSRVFRQARIEPWSIDVRGVNGLSGYIKGTKQTIVSVPMTAETQVGSKWVGIKEVLVPLSKDVVDYLWDLTPTVPSGFTKITMSVRTDYREKADRITLRAEADARVSNAVNVELQAEALTPVVESSLRTPTSDSEILSSMTLPPWVDFSQAGLSYSDWDNYVFSINRTNLHFKLAYKMNEDTSIKADQMKPGHYSEFGVDSRYVRGLLLNVRYKGQRGQDPICMLEGMSLTGGSLIPVNTTNPNTDDPVVVPPKSILPEPLLPTDKLPEKPSDEDTDDFSYPGSGKYLIGAYKSGNNSNNIYKMDVITKAETLIIRNSTAGKKLKIDYDDNKLYAAQTGSIVSDGAGKYNIPIKIYDVSNGVNTLVATLTLKSPSNYSADMLCIAKHNNSKRVIFATGPRHSDPSLVWYVDTASIAALDGMTLSSTWTNSHLHRTNVFQNASTKLFGYGYNWAGTEIWYMEYDFVNNTSKIIQSTTWTDLYELLGIDNTHIWLYKSSKVYKILRDYSDISSPTLYSSTISLPYPYNVNLGFA